MDRLTRPRAPGPHGSQAPRQRRAFSVIRGPVETEGSAEEARILASLFSVDFKLERALTHGFHSYAGKLHPSIARGAVGRFTPPGATVLDPFCGSGTVLVEALVAGRKAIGIDASPLAVLIARVRTRRLPEGWRRDLVARAQAIATEVAGQARARIRPRVPRWAPEVAGRYHPHVALELFALRAEIVATPADDPLGQALRLCLSSLLVKLMRSGPEAPRDGQEKRIARGFPSRFFAERAEELAAGLAELALVTPEGTPPAGVHLGDACDYPDIPARSVDLVLSSPPYAGVYDYAEQHAVRFRWLGLPIEDLRERQLGERRGGPGAARERWQEGRRRWLQEMARVLRPSGMAVLVVGDGVVGKKPEDAARAVAEAAEEAGLWLVASASQTRPPQNPTLRQIFGAQRRREHLLLLRKG
jgi:SAM-dependent methyltransferase